MAWTLVVIMITANAGSVLTSRAVESTPVSQDGQDGQSQKDQLKEPASEEFKNRQESVISHLYRMRSKAGLDRLQRA